MAGVGSLIGIQDVRGPCPDTGWGGGAPAPGFLGLWVFTLAHTITPGAGWNPGSDGNARFRATRLGTQARREGTTPESTPFQPPAQEPALDPRSSGPRRTDMPPGPPESLIHHSRGHPSDSAPCPPGPLPLHALAIRDKVPPPGRERESGRSGRWDKGGSVAGAAAAAPIQGPNANGYVPPRPS